MRGRNPPKSEVVEAGSWGPDSRRIALEAQLGLIRTLAQNRDALTRLMPGFARADKLAVKSRRAAPQCGAANRKARYQSASYIACVP